MARRPSDMDLGDTFEIQYRGYEFEIEYCVSRGLYDGDGDRYYFRARMIEGDGENRAGFHFWRSPARVAKIAAKRAIKDHKKQQEPSTPERIKSALS